MGKLFTEIKKDIANKIVNIDDNIPDLLENIENYGTKRFRLGLFFGIFISALILFLGWVITGLIFI